MCRFLLWGLLGMSPKHQVLMASLGGEGSRSLECTVQGYILSLAPSLSSLLLNHCKMSSSLIMCCLPRCFASPQAQKQWSQMTWTKISETMRQNKNFLPLVDVLWFCHSEGKMTNTCGNPIYISISLNPVSWLEVIDRGLNLRRIFYFYILQIFFSFIFKIKIITRLDYIIICLMLNTEEVLRILVSVAPEPICRQFLDSAQHPGNEGGPILLHFLPETPFLSVPKLHGIVRTFSRGIWNKRVVLPLVPGNPWVKDLFSWFLCEKKGHSFQRNVFTLIQEEIQVHRHRLSDAIV
jgi:hypothetical protein